MGLTLVCPSNGRSITITQASRNPIAAADAATPERLVVVGAGVGREQERDDEKTRGRRPEQARQRDRTRLDHLLAIFGEIIERLQKFGEQRLLAHVARDERPRPARQPGERFVRSGTPVAGRKRGPFFLHQHRAETRQIGAQRDQFRPPGAKQRAINRGERRSLLADDRFDGLKVAVALD